MNYDDENSSLLENFFERTFYKAWKEGSKATNLNFRNLEIILNYKCNLACKYCYVHKFGEELYPSKLYADEERLLSNLSIFLDWIIEKGFNPKIDYFSGEALVQRVGFKGLNMMLDKLGGHCTGPIVIPTNYTFLLSETLTKNVENILIHSRKIELPIHLSASDDGKFCNENRPFKDSCEDPRDDAYYDKLFAFNKKWKMGFHPMIYSEKIELWKENFLWFQDMMKKHDIPWSNIYLLEVRNAEWTPTQTVEFTKFIDFLIEWTFNKLDRNINKYIDFVFKQRGFNILANPLTSIGRGIGCSYQSAMYVRMGDLAIVPCHRTCYEQFVAGYFKIIDEKISGIEAHNPEVLIAGLSMIGDNFPYCEQCPINTLCSQGCLGAQVEVTGDLYTPIPTVCRMEMAKLLAMYRKYVELGIWEVLKVQLPPEKVRAFEILDEISKDVKMK